MHKVFEIPGHLLALDLDGLPDDCPRHIVGIYVPTVLNDRCVFFHKLFEYCVPHTVLLGDFNSVTDVVDRFLGALDPTSSQLSHLLAQHSFVELRGTHQYSFTYHHPAVSNRKSQLNHIYFNYSIESLCGSSHHVSFSDHYLVEAYKLPVTDSGPHLWKLSPDMLSNQNFIDYMNCQFQLFNDKNPITSWENIKLKAQLKVQSLSKFHQKQFNKELHGLCSMLRYINNRIFQGEILKTDRIKI